MFLAIVRSRLGETGISETSREFALRNGLARRVTGTALKFMAENGEIGVVGNRYFPLDWLPKSFQKRKVADGRGSD